MQRYIILANENTREGAFIARLANNGRYVKIANVFDANNADELVKLANLVGDRMDNGQLESFLKGELRPTAQIQQFWGDSKVQGAGITNA